MTNPVALAIGLSNSVYVADGTTNQVHAYVGGASFLILDSPAITGVSNIFVDTNANLFLASAGQVFESSNLPRANAGFARIGTPGSAWVTMNVPAGNSITTISATDLAGDSEWTLPTGNVTCTVATSSVCSFQVKFSPVYPGMRAGTVTVKDAVSSTHTVDLYGVGQGPQATFLTGNKTTIAATWVPSALTTDTAGNVYVLDQTNSSAPIIQKITPAGAVSTALDPTNAGGGSDSSVAVDGQGNIYMEPVNEGPGIFEYFKAVVITTEPLKGAGQLRVHSRSITQANSTVLAATKSWLHLTALVQHAFHLWPTDRASADHRKQHRRRQLEKHLRHHLRARRLASPTGPARPPTCWTAQPHPAASR